MADREYLTFLLDLLAPLGGVSARRMFGGHGLFRDGLMFGLVADDRLHFKTDAASAPEFEAEGSEPFSYDTRQGRRTITSYWRVPDRLFDDPDDLVAWARRAVAASVGAASRTRPAGRGRRGRQGASSTAP